MRLLTIYGFGSESLCGGDRALDARLSLFLNDRGGGALRGPSRGSRTAGLVSSGSTTHAATGVPLGSPARGRRRWSGSTADRRGGRAIRPPLGGVWSTGAGTGHPQSEATTAKSAADVREYYRSCGIEAGPDRLTAERVRSAVTVLGVRLDAGVPVLGGGAGCALPPPEPSSCPGRTARMISEIRGRPARRPWPPPRSGGGGERAGGAQVAERAVALPSTTKV